MFISGTTKNGLTWFRKEKNTMQNGNNTIILIDDDPVMLDLHSAYLEGAGYDILTAINGKDALKKIRDNVDEIDVIISDVSMPEMDGYELCKQIKEDSDLLHLPVIFVSALSTLEEKLKGYSVGADDYLIKPIDEKELLEKSKVLIDRKKLISNLNKSSKESQSVALEAMTFSSELGQVIEFYKNMFAATDYEGVANYLFELVEQYQLNCSIQIYTPSKVINLSSSGIVSPLEANVIEMARKKERFFDFGSRTVINYERFSLLIKNMPENEPERYGRVKDLFGMIANGLEAKIHQLNSELLSDKRQDIIKSIQNSLTTIESSFEEVQKENILSIEDLNDDITEALTILCLQEYQEENIQKIVEQCLVRVNKSFYKAINIRENLTNIHNQVQTVLGI